ncbi:MAG: ribonuclease HII [Candidatus Kerfeldbacteria bacterium]|nr:ribonuclease HII [Candidatus Kerfeldbacteria bacterium]
MFNKPTHANEKRLMESGYRAVAGVDEVGRGTWAGPIAAGAVVMPLHPIVKGARDSKALSPKKREALAKEIKETALAWCVAYVEASEIDEMGITAANELVMVRAIQGLKVQPDFVLVDAFKFLAFPYKYTAVPHGDATIYSIACASIIAKVDRDARMQQIAVQYPEYGFDVNKGYGTQLHKQALDQYGITREHRKSFQPMRGME